MMGLFLDSYLVNTFVTYEVAAQIRPLLERWHNWLVNLCHIPLQGARSELELELEPLFDLKLPLKVEADKLSLRPIINLTMISGQGEVH